MLRALRCGVTALLAWASAVAGAAPELGDAARGYGLYSGQIPLRSTTTRGAPVPAAQAACVQCHRPSGLGGFEGNTAIPPIAARYLFKPFNPDTANFFPQAARQRVRPAYDAASLGEMLRTGRTPDGLTSRAPMPVYEIGDSDVIDLTAYLRGLSLAPVPGVDETTLRIATITTPGVDATRAEAMLTVLRRFEVSRNSQTRHEAQRSAQSTRTREMVMNRKFRVWRIVHWALEGEPDSWLAQLERRYAEEPVFGVLSGMGTGDWSPVDSFCERRHLPCILPQVEQVPALVAPQTRFYSLYFHAGLDHDLTLAIGALQRAGASSVELWMDDVAPATQKRLAQQVRAAGLVQVERAGAATDAVLSVLAPDVHITRWQSRASRPAFVAWVPGARSLSVQQWSDGVAGAAAVVLVSPFRPPDEAARSMQRANSWLRSMGLQNLPADVASSSLYAATVFGEAMAHLDFDFTREYMLELLEHRLESIVPLSPYPRMAIGPGQRIASKGSWVGVVREGQVDWQWQPGP
ncbi:MAG: c-type cytochrome [Burkholderiaceae bacterium]